jgi:putative ABC transport system permease protein
MSTRRGGPRRNEEDFAREIESHIDLEAARLVDAGTSPDEAHALAKRHFGNVTIALERFHERGRVMWLDHLVHDLRCAARNIRRYPVAALVAVTSLAGGIGATTVTLAVREAIFHKYPPLYRDPVNLSRVQTGRPDRPIYPAGSPVPVSLYMLWSATSPYQMGAEIGLGTRDVRAGDRSNLAVIRAVTPGFFDVLGVSPAIGRTFTASRTDAAAIPAMLSHRVWQTMFEGRSDAVGQSIWIDGRPHTIVGVLPERFWFSGMDSPIWTRLDPAALAPDDGVEMIVRRPAGLSGDALAAELQNGLTSYAARQPASQREIRLRVSGVEGTPLGHQMSFVLPYLLGSSVFLTLLIACANVAILMIAQWTAREHEIAIRTSIGANRSRIIKGLLTESMVVALLGGALGILVTIALRGWVVQRGGNLTFFDLTIDPRIVLQSAAVTLAAGILTGIAPALYETRRLHTNPLRLISSSDRVRQRWRHALVIFEITVTVALLVETAAMIDGYQRARRAEIGFSLTPLLTVRVENASGVPTPQLLEAFAAVPGVSAVAASTGVPFAMAGTQVSVAGDVSDTVAVAANRAAITPGFFSVLGVALRAGRPFTQQDFAAARAVIINESLAKRLFPTGGAVGQRVWLQGAACDVIGVVADYANNPIMPPSGIARIFQPLPLASPEITRLQFVMRAAGDPAPLVQPTRRKALQVAAGTSATSAYTFSQYLDAVGQEILVGTAPLFPLIVIGMFLTASGIYGVLAFAVTRRSRELAIRMAVGATSADVTRLVGLHGLRLLGAGTLLGGGLTFALARLVRASGGGGSMFDPGLPAFLVPVLLVLTVGVLAMWVPSRRARLIDPAVLLKGE